MVKNVKLKRQALFAGNCTFRLNALNTDEDVFLYNADNV